MDCYFGLAGNFMTQAEPACACAPLHLHAFEHLCFLTARRPHFSPCAADCGLSCLAMVLNTLEVDPGRRWKGVWRWYSEDMLDCCTPLEVRLARTWGAALGRGTRASAGASAWCSQPAPPHPSLCALSHLRALSHPPSVRSIRSGSSPRASRLKSLPAWRSATACRSRATTPTARTLMARILADTRGLALT